MYIVTYSTSLGPSVPVPHPSNCYPDRLLKKIDPTGSVTYTCITNNSIFQDPSTLVTINQELNSIINQGYKLIYTSSSDVYNSNTTAVVSSTILPSGFVGNTIWYFAIP